MSIPVIVCVDDQREVLAALLKDLAFLAPHVEVQPAESADEAWDLLADLAAAGRDLPVIISDHIMPGTTGVDLLRRLDRDPRYTDTRSLLLTGLATQADTIRAINEARLDRYLAKPWSPAELRVAVCELLTRYAVDRDLDPRRLPGLLDPQVLIAAQRQAGDR